MAMIERAYSMAKSLAAVIVAPAVCVLLAAGAVYAKGPGQYVHVHKVIDGDTIAIEGDDRVRYLGIDAPERGEPFYEEALRRNSALVGGKTVRIVVCEEERRDRYGRLLAWVYSDGALVNRTLLSEGLARLFMVPPCGMEKAGDFERVEKDAIAKKVGIWSAGTPRDARAPVVIAPTEAVLHAGEYVRVKGRVVRVHRAKGAVFIDFAEERGKGFTAVILKRSFPEFEAVGVDPLRYRGRVVSVSGIVSLYRSRPEIVVKLPRQITED